MKLSQLRGRDVVSIAQASKLGTVDNIVLDLDRRSILGLQVRTGGLLHSRQAVLLSDVKAIGESAVTIADASRLNSQDKFSELKDRPTADVLLGARVITESGTELGNVADLTIDLGAAQITEYILGESLLARLRGKEYYISSSSVRSLGERLVVVADSEAADTENGGTPEGTAAS